jgi:glycosyltransferase involved in cell wall biosynthesis
LNRSKICHITTVHQALDDRIFFKECVFLRKAGYDVFLVAPDQKNEYPNHDITIVGLTSTGNRFYRATFLAFKAFVKALKTQASVFHFHDPELMFIGVLLKLFGKKVIYDVHEDLPKQIYYKPYIPTKLLKSVSSLLVKYIELFCCLFFDLIVAATDDIARKFPASKTIVIRNLAIVGLIDQVESHHPKSEKFVLVYAGGLSEERGIKEIILALEKVDMPIELWLLGPWASESYQKLCSSLPGFAKTKYLGFMPMDKVYPYIKAADVGIALLYPAKNYVTSLPVKAFEYMACRKPIIMSNFDYWKKIFGGCALFTDPLNPDKIARAIEQLYSNKTLADELSVNGRKLIMEQYSWESESIKLINAYHQLLYEN